jgi:biopolymer transport protein ExbB
MTNSLARSQGAIGSLGLVVAVPAVLAYNWLIRRNKAIQEDLAAFTNDLHGYLMSNGAVKPNIGAPGAAKTVTPGKTATAQPRTPAGAQ